VVRERGKRAGVVKGGGGMRKGESEVEGAKVRWREEKEAEEGGRQRC